MVGKTKQEPKRASRLRPDGRKPFLAYLDRDLIKALKKAALDDDRNAYEIVEEAVGDYLAARGKRGRGE